MSASRVSVVLLLSASLTGADTADLRKSAYANPPSVRADGQGTDGAASKDEFTTIFMEALKKEDIEQLARLHCWDGVDDEVKADRMAQLKSLCRNKDAIKAASFIPLSQEPSLQAKRTIKAKGKLYAFNLETSELFKVDSSHDGVPTSLTFRVGKKNGRYFFPVIAPQ